MRFLSCLVIFLFVTVLSHLIDGSSILELVIVPIISIIVIILNKDFISSNKKYWNSFFRLIIPCILGVLIGKIINYVIWYWIQHPEYLSLSGDMHVGFIVSSIIFSIDVFLIFLSFFVGMIIIE